MEPLSLIQIAGTCAGTLLGGPPGALTPQVIPGSRLAAPGCLFVAIKGERLDGHDYIAEAVRGGVTAVMVEESRPASIAFPCATVAVASTRRALGDMAAFHRSRFAIPAIAVGGSNGKTTTKELLRAVLSQGLVTLASEASFNNDIGVPLTLFKLESAHQAAVLEVGTNHPGEMAPLLRLIRPRYGVLTSLGREHLEFFGTVEGVIEEEGWLAEVLPADGALFVDGGSHGIERVLSRARSRVVRVGWTPRDDWQALRACVDGGGTTLLARGPRDDLSGEYHMRLLGRHQVTNALLALAVGAELGLTRGQLQRGLAACPPPRMRLQLHEWHGVRVLDDSYNANADSMRAAIETMCDVADSGRSIAVLGDMAELGDQSRAAHAEVGEFAALMGIEHLFAVGSMASLLCGAARAAGMGDAREFADAESAATAVKNFVRPGDLVLVKASRATRLERVVERLEQDMPHT